MGGRKSRKDEDATTEAPEDDLELRRNLQKGNKRGGRKSDGDSTREPKDSTADPRERKSRDDSERESKDVTREPKGRKGGRKSRKDEDATLAAKATDVVAVNLMATALGNQKTPLLNHVSEKAATIQNASRRMLPVNPRVAREAENLAKMKTPPQKHQKMILNFDATLAAKATDVVAVNLMATALGNQKT